MYLEIFHKILISWLNYTLMSLNGGDIISRWSSIIHLDDIEQIFKSTDKFNIISQEVFLENLNIKNTPAMFFNGRPILGYGVQYLQHMRIKFGSIFLCLTTRFFECNFFLILGIKSIRRLNSKREQNACGLSQTSNTNRRG